MSSFCKCKSYSHFFSKNISVYAIFNYQSFNNTLTNDIVSFEQLGPECLGNYSIAPEMTHIFQIKRTEPLCSKLKKVVSQHEFKISILKYGKYIDIFCWKNASSFCKSYSHFCSKNIKNVLENTLDTTIK